MLYSIGNTLWLDPLVQRQKMAVVQQWVDNLNIRTLLLEQNYAVENAEVRCGFIGSAVFCFAHATVLSILYVGLSVC